MMEREEINAIGKALQSLRCDDERALFVEFGAHGLSTDTRNGSVSVTIMKAGHRFTYEAVSLQDALFGARAGVDREIAAKAKKAATRKAQS
jgi:hypothetical protein